MWSLFKGEKESSQAPPSQTPPSQAPLSHAPPSHAPPPQAPPSIKVSVQAEESKSSRSTKAMETLSQQNQRLESLQNSLQENRDERQEAQNQMRSIIESLYPQRHNWDERSIREQIEYSESLTAGLKKLSPEERAELKIISGQFAANAKSKSAAPGTLQAESFKDSENDKQVPTTGRKTLLNTNRSMFYGHGQDEQRPSLRNRETGKFEKCTYAFESDDEEATNPNEKCKTEGCSKKAIGGMLCNGCVEAGILKRLRAKINWALERVD